MRVITRQLAKEILFSSGFVLIALVALFAFFDLVGQLDDVADGRTIMQAFTLTAFTLPARIYEVMPLAALLASVYTMSRWAATSEFTCLRVAGMSPVTLALSLMLPGIILVGITYTFGEFIAPAASRYAAEVKSISNNQTTRTARGYSSGVWVRDVTTGERGLEIDRYINVKYLNATDSAETGGWRLFEFDKQGRIRVFIESESAHFEPGKGWLLKDVVRYDYPVFDAADNKPLESRIEMTKADELLLHSSLGPDTLSVMTVKPDTMSMRDLDRYVSHLKKNNQQSEHYEVAFWNKAFYPARHARDDRAVDAVRLHECTLRRSGDQDVRRRHDRHCLLRAQQPLLVSGRTQHLVADCGESGADSEHVDHGGRRHVPSRAAIASGPAFEKRKARSSTCGPFACVLGMGTF